MFIGHQHSSHKHKCRIQPQSLNQSYQPHRQSKVDGSRFWFHGLPNEIENDQKVSHRNRNGPSFQS